MKLPTLGDAATQGIRTGVPIAVGGLVTWAATKWHIVLSPRTELGVDLTAGAIAANAYNAGAHALERRWPKLGWLLGVAKAPTYSKP